MEVPARDYRDMVIKLFYSILRPLKVFYQSSAHMHFWRNTEGSFEMAIGVRVSAELKILSVFRHHPDVHTFFTASVYSTCTIRIAYATIHGPLDLLVLCFAPFGSFEGMTSYS